MRLISLTALTLAAAATLAVGPGLAQNVRDSLLPNSANNAGQSSALPQQPSAVAGSLTIQQIPKSDPQSSNFSASPPPALEANDGKR